ncbi:YbaB/EbfC family nucleoid-associated protein [Rhodococcus sp. CH91]|uniref:YbaB/EbfC family nucleoid-associated protein n=1 Tax=Rhodococcus sp. CH91 TaxID=2910256 RepID=UPI001F4BAF56|nr:YbaB/EbfC family nucleoid-associated protein [Rhodococcus sp. CH91]
MSEAVVDSVVARAHNRLDALERTAEALSTIEGSASSPDGRVLARVNGSGALDALDLCDSIRDADARELAATILETVHEAARDAALARVAAWEALRCALTPDTPPAPAASDRAVRR